MCDTMGKARAFVMFPKPELFDTFGDPWTKNTATEVLDEASKLVAAFTDGNVIDRAMDLYQAYANYIGLTEPAVVSLIPSNLFRREQAVAVLQCAAMLYADQYFDSLATEASSRFVLMALADLIVSAYTNDEIAEAYRRCVRRNRWRGRYEHVETAEPSNAEHDGDVAIIGDAHGRTSEV